MDQGVTNTLRPLLKEDRYIAVLFGNNYMCCRNYADTCLAFISSSTNMLHRSESYDLSTRRLMEESRYDVQEQKQHEGRHHITFSE